mgnify:CR=1 FL=1|tara:strand:+ start:2000 stop:2239 length:240 start_codon:yes stop_codon:yes gene_type:complete
MEKEIIEILKDNFKDQDIDKARKELCFLFRIKRSDDPICPSCAKAELTSLGNYVDEEGMSGAEYICDDCENIFDFNDYE